LLGQWYQHKGQKLYSPLAHQPEPSTEQDAVGLWLAACGKRVEGAWVANSDIMISYTKWCEVHGQVPKKAKGLSQSLAAHGLEVGVRQWVSTGPGRRTKTRGVRGLYVLDNSQTVNIGGDRSF